MKYCYSIFDIKSKNEVKNDLFNTLIPNYKENIIYYNEYGKPYFKDINIFFNISHSFDYMIAVMDNCEVGIDLEKIRPVKKELIDFIATLKEKKYIYSKNYDIEKRVFEIYTLKEAYFKMKGTGIQDFKNVEFIIMDDNIVCSDKRVLPSLHLDIDNYIFAICEQKSAATV